MTGGVPPGTPCLFARQDLYIRDHSEVHDVTVLACGMVNLPQGLQDIFFVDHAYLTMFISLRR